MGEIRHLLTPSSRKSARWGFVGGLSVDKGGIDWIGNTAFLASCTGIASSGWVQGESESEGGGRGALLSLCEERGWDWTCL